MIPTEQIERTKFYVQCLDRRGLIHTRNAVQAAVWMVHQLTKDGSIRDRIDTLGRIEESTIGVSQHGWSDGEEGREVYKIAGKPLLTAIQHHGREPPK